MNYFGFILEQTFERWIYAMDLKISKWGNSQGIRIPLPILEQMGINSPDGESVSISVNNDGVATLKRAVKFNEYADLFKGFDYKAYTGKTSLGNRENRLGDPVGKEKI
ncbi:AbrB/MazE/SpoVT family DNA-binding domain-containing protein [Lacticaseibacillus paracasei]|nr:AbrB/MazE/SpoVT family DNA-binding domain-containing protein [Lacticaseibacillus paracasei]